VTKHGTRSPVIGRYVEVTVLDEQYEVYYETNADASPAGIPLVCQHTAGNDGRQYRDLLLDAEVAADYTVYALDLPRHGKSNPPGNKEFWKEEYKLTRKWFVEFYLRFCSALNLKDPVFMGQAIGGQLALYLAIDAPEAFRAAIAFSPNENAPGFYHDYWDHPRVNGTGASYASSFGLNGAAASERQRHLNAWYNSQGAPGVVNGDLYFYSVDHDLRGDKLPKIKTDQCMLYMLSGEFDYTAFPEKTRTFSRRIPGSKFVEMKGLGHYPAIENYDVFRTYLLPILKEIKG
jgi:pimeloyl-ACP methyl ester carboxylesterase